MACLQLKDTLVVGILAPQWTDLVMHCLDCSSVDCLMDLGAENPSSVDCLVYLGAESPLLAQMQLDGLLTSTQPIWQCHDNEQCPF